MPDCRAWLGHAAGEVCYGSPPGFLSALPVTNDTPRHDLTSRQRARLLMEAVAALHASGYGRLKLFSYVKDGLGAWRHGLFAADHYPTAGEGPPRLWGSGSMPGWSVADGDSVAEVVNSLRRGLSKQLELALGADDAYVAWFRDVLDRHPDGVIEMEDASSAKVDGRQVRPLVSWGSPGR